MATKEQQLLHLFADLKAATLSPPSPARAAAIAEPFAKLVCLACPASREKQQLIERALLTALMDIATILRDHPLAPTFLTALSEIMVRVLTNVAQTGARLRQQLGDAPGAGSLADGTPCAALVADALAEVLRMAPPTPETPAPAPKYTAIEIKIVAAVSAVLDVIWPRRHVTDGAVPGASRAANDWAAAFGADGTDLLGPPPPYS